MDKNDLTFEIKNMQMSCLNIILCKAIEIEEICWSVIEKNITLQKALSDCMTNFVYVLKFSPEIFVKLSVFFQD